MTPIPISPSNQTVISHLEEPDESSNSQGGLVSSERLNDHIDPTFESMIGPIVDPTSEPMIEPMIDRVIDPISEPIINHIDLMIDPASEPMIDPTSEPIILFEFAEKTSNLWQAWLARTS